MSRANISDPPQKRLKKNPKVKESVFDQHQEAQTPSLCQKIKEIVSLFQVRELSQVLPAGELSKALKAGRVKLTQPLWLMKILFGEQYFEIQDENADIIIDGQRIAISDLYDWIAFVNTGKLTQLSLEKIKILRQALLSQVEIAQFFKEHLEELAQLLGWDDLYASAMEAYITQVKRKLQAIYEKVDQGMMLDEFEESFLSAIDQASLIGMKTLKKAHRDSPQEALRNQFGVWQELVIQIKARKKQNLSHQKRRDYIPPTPSPLSS